MNIKPGEIAAFVGVIIVAVITLPLITNVFWTESDLEVPEGWQYDDYQVAENTVASASGAIELVEINDVTYLHANGVGEGVITYSDSSTETITVSKAILDFYCINGQSNATYNQVTEMTNPATADPYPALGQGYFIDMLTSYHSPISWYDSNGDPNVGNIPPSFVATYYEETHHKVLVTMAGVNGRSILKFQPDQEMYNRTLSAMGNPYEDFNSDYYEYGNRVMIWIQGEADNDYMTSSEYYDYFMTFWEGIQSESAHPFDYCMISYLTENYTTITAADKQLINNNSDIYLGSDVAQSFTDDNGYLKGDGVHYSQAGRNVLGASLAEQAVYLLQHQKIEGYNGTYKTIIDLFPVLILAGLVFSAASMLVRRYY